MLFECFDSFEGAGLVANFLLELETQIDDGFSFFVKSAYGFCELPLSLGFLPQSDVGGRLLQFERLLPALLIELVDLLC